jgi:hypothetical protein
MATRLNPKTAEQAPLAAAILGAILMQDSDSSAVKAGRALVQKSQASKQLDAAKFRRSITKLIKSRKPLP